MKNLAVFLILALAFSCDRQSTYNGKIVASNPYLIGKWIGEGKFLDVDLDKEIGSVKIEIEIKEDNTILGKIGEANLLNTSIGEVKYGFEIRGKLDSKLNQGSDLKKDCLIILLVLPEGNRQSVTKSDANFHLKSNFTFDFTMRVGGVILTKER